MPECFTQMPMPEACQECDTTPPEPVLDNCPVCHQRVALHCSTCKIQTTGCVCVDRKRFDPVEAWERTVGQMGERAARRVYRDQGWAIPGEDLILPS